MLPSTLKFLNPPLCDALGLLPTNSICDFSLISVGLAAAKTTIVRPIKPRTAKDLRDNAVTSFFSELIVLGDAYLVRRFSMAWPWAIAPINSSIWRHNDLGSQLVSTSVCRTLLSPMSVSNQQPLSIIVSDRYSADRPLRCRLLIDWEERKERRQTLVKP